MDTPSLADIAAITKDNDGMCGNGAWWIIILFVVLFGAGGFGNYGSDIGRYATAASQQEILFGQQFQALDNKIDRIGNGIADATFALNNSIGVVGSQVAEAKYDNAIRLADTNAAIANCCCTTQRNIDGVNYNIAQQAAAINSNIDAKFAAMEKMQLEQKIADLQAQVAQQNLAAQMAGVVRYPNGYTYTAGQSPFCSCGCGGNI